MENQNTKEKMFEKCIWTIRNFSKIDSKKLYSEKFFIDDHTWRFLMFPKGNKLMYPEWINEDYLSIYLVAGGDHVNLPCGWKKFANFKLVLINQVNDKRNIIKETSHMFNADEIDWGFPTFIPLGELCYSSGGFIVNDTCIIQVEILVNKSKHENQVDQSVSKISTSSGELVNFRGIGKVEQDFVPLLEEVCSRYPSLIDSKRKRSQRFIEWAFTALGRVLHFLKTKKVRDMNEDAYNHLQILWEELETCRFDLTWLEPHVQSALGMKTCVERVVRVKSLEEDVTALERETKRLKTKMIEAKVKLEITRRDLVNAKEGFEECDLDAALGYGGP